MKEISRELLLKAKQYGFSDTQLAQLWKTDESTVRALRMRHGIIPVFKTVDTCAAEFEAYTPYHYSTYEVENESVRSNKKKVIILGGGPNRIGQGIEFDYCCVHGVMALREEGYEAQMINCNPETVSTDYDTTDKLYFEPLTFEDVMNIIDFEKPDGVIISFGGQTPLKLAKQLEAAGVKILGTSPEGIDLAEDRKRFGELLTKLNIPCPPWGTATNAAEAIEVAERIGYPVLVRPSYVLGGRAMEICYRRETIEEYMQKAVGVSPAHPILIDKFLEDSYEFDVDAVGDGDDVVIGGVMQHIEEAGIHSGDSSCVLPPYNLSGEHFKQIVEYTKQLARALNVVGLINVQYAMQHDTLYVLEVNPRASRTVPFVSKATGIPLAKIGAKVMVGKKLRAMKMKDFAPEKMKHVAIKESVFPFAKFPKFKVMLGPEMRSTGEVMGVDMDFGEAMAKANAAAGSPLPLDGTIFISLRDLDKRARAAEIAKDFHDLGFELIATEGTRQFLLKNKVPCSPVAKIGEGHPDVTEIIRDGDVHLVINTPSGESARTDEYHIGWSAIENKVPFITTLSAALAAVSAIRSLRKQTMDVTSLQEFISGK
ncbi:MAG TPA: carbamoyl-phosphate synthase large subunit [Candidatus Kapabacteria bacterium]|nr:carbamoyl-phosphate synthase large subunit [Candidatus Kapabacteria bacterium]